MSNLVKQLFSELIIAGVGVAYRYLIHLKNVFIILSVTNVYSFFMKNAPMMISVINVFSL